MRMLIRISPFSAYAGEMTMAVQKTILEDTVSYSCLRLPLSGVVAYGALGVPFFQR